VTLKRATLISMEVAPRFDRRLAVAVFAALGLGLSAAAAPGLRLPDLDNRLIDPFETAADTRAIVFLFISVDCPISNRYAPEIRRLSDKFASRGVIFRLVYPNPSESPEAIRAHLKDYRYPGSAMRDSRQQLARFTKATITPEAALYDRQGRRLYLGRIDDRYVNLGLERPAPTRHDLEEALDDTLAGKPVRQATAPAVGCFIADFAQ
jgi:hypothetical protein